MAGTTTTVTGTGTLTTLLVSTGTNLPVLQNQYTSLLQGANVTVTGSGTTVLFLGRVSTTHDNACGVEIDVDETTVFYDGAGTQVIARVPLTAGDHVVEFKAFGLANDVTAEVFGLTIIDLGL